MLRISEDMKESKVLSPGFMIKEGVITPYYDLQINHNIIENITISPMLEEKLEKKGLEILAERLKMENITISKSQISIRY